MSLRCLLPDIGKNSEFLISLFSNVTCNPRINQPASEAKHLIDAKRGKKCNLCQARENRQPVRENSSLVLILLVKISD